MLLQHPIVFSAVYRFLLYFFVHMKSNLSWKLIFFCCLSMWPNFQFSQFYGFGHIYTAHEQTKTTGRQKEKVELNTELIHIYIGIQVKCTAHIFLWPSEKLAIQLFCGLSSCTLHNGWRQKPNSRQLKTKKRRKTIFKLFRILFGCLKGKLN